MAMPAHTAKTTTIGDPRNFLAEDGWLSRQASESILPDQTFQVYDD